MRQKMVGVNTPNKAQCILPHFLSYKFIKIKPCITLNKILKACNNFGTAYISLNPKYLYAILGICLII